MGDAVRELWPELEWIEDAELREATAKTWETAMERSPLEPQDLREIPFTLLVPGLTVTFMEHKRAVVHIARRSAEAMAEFGEIEGGRRYALERSAEEMETVHVAGEFETGSTPLGPFVYVNDEGEVSTVICRCMPTQVESIEGSVEIDADAPAEKIAALKAAVDAHCPVLDMLSTPVPTKISLA